MLYTKDGSYPQPKPHRVRLSNGFTRTAEAITHDNMLEAGYTVAPDYPTQEGEVVNWLPVRWDSETSNWIIGEQQ